MSAQLWDPNREPDDDRSSGTPPPSTPPQPAHPPTAGRPGATATPSEPAAGSGETRHAEPRAADSAQPEPPRLWSPRAVPPPSPGRPDPEPTPIFPSQPIQQFPSQPAPPPLPPVQDGNLEPLRIPTARQEDGTAADRIRIGLWGAPRSGKTTFLAALPIAAMQFQRHGDGNWLIGGMTPEANTFLSDNVTKLAIDRAFPINTSALEGMSWSFQGQEPIAGMTRKRFRDASFVLEIQDAPGEAFRSNNPLHARVIDQLAGAQGLLYVFDPLGDASEASQSLTFFFATLNELNNRIRNAGSHYRGRLPHHVSVCIAKFDHPDLFRPAVEAGWVTQDTVGSQLPRVPEHLAEGYFQWLCNDFRGSTARLVRDGLAAYFHPERVRYYATSAIGFRLNPQHVFDYRNYANVEIVDGAPRICTSPEPINVLEPLTDLERRIRTTRDARKGWRR